MVKIKEGYVMTANEQKEYDRVNALPRKMDGQVAYYYKPQTKYPPRIYVFMQAEQWCDRNRRPMGLYGAFPFLTRPMNREEIEYHHFNTRLCYHQYEDWEKLLYAEEKEAAELDKEQPGLGADFHEKLKSFRERYSLKSTGHHNTLAELLETGKDLSAAEISALLKKEQEGQSRPAVLVLLRQLYKNTVLEDDLKVYLTPSAINRKVFLAEERRRKNMVRRIYNRNPLFALEEIRHQYPGYTEEQLAADLLKKQHKERRKKVKPITDLRRCQLKKLAACLNHPETSEKDYHHTCCRMVMLQTAHDLRLPIPLVVKLDNNSLVYTFNWKTRENVVKSFASLANTKGMSHQVLGEKYKEITSSNYSF